MWKKLHSYSTPSDETGGLQQNEKWKIVDLSRFSSIKQE